MANLLGVVMFGTAAWMATVVVLLGLIAKRLRTSR